MKKKELMSVKQVNIQVKQLSKISAEVESVSLSIVIDSELLTVAEFLKAVVLQQVEQYLQRFKEQSREDKLTQIEEALGTILFTGKLRFSSPVKYKDIDVAQEQQRVLQAFEDQLFLLFYGEQEFTTLSQEIVLNDNNSFVFIPLNFLKSTF